MAKYIDKLEFHNLLKDYKNFDNMLLNEESELLDDDTKRSITKKKNKAYEQIGKRFLLIAENYLNKPSYINYSQDWKDDMVSEAVLDMVRYIHNYDVDRMEKRYTEKGKIPDPFSYFSQYVYNGIMRYLSEKKKDDILVRLPFIENMDKREVSYE